LFELEAFRNTLDAGMREREMLEKLSTLMVSLAWALKSAVFTSDGLDKEGKF
jgi:hypothetical protein